MDDFNDKSLNSRFRKALTLSFDGKVDEVAGKGLSTNDFTTAYKTKLDEVYSGYQSGVVTISGASGARGYSGYSGASAPTYGINQQSGTTYTLVLTDANKLITMNNAADATITVPTNALVEFPIGTKIDIVQLNSGVVTISGVGVTVNSKTGYSAISGQYYDAKLTKYLTDTWILTGNMANLVT